MRLKFMVILLLPFLLNAQTVYSTTFSNFKPNLTVSDGAVYWFVAGNDSSNVLKDISGGSHTLVKPSGWTLTYPTTSALKSGQGALLFESTGSNFLAAADHADFDITTTHSLILLFKPIDLSQSSEYLFEKRNARYGMIWEFTNNKAEYVISGQTGDNLRTGSGITATTDWNMIVYTYEPTSQKGYLNGVEQFDSTKTTTLAASTDSFYVGASGAAGHANFYDGYIEYIAVIKGVALTAKQVAEAGFLANGWVSKNGKVTRNLNTPEFYQTFYDTIGVPLSDATLGNNQVWQLSYKGKSSDATKTIKAWIGSASSAKSSIYTVTAGTAFATNTVNFGDGFALSSDTLWFASASTADTVSVDDVVLSKYNVAGQSGWGYGWGY